MTSNRLGLPLKALAIGMALSLLPTFVSAEGEKPRRIQRENQAKGRQHMGVKPRSSKPRATPRSTPRTSPRSTPRTSPRSTPRTSPRSTPRTSPRRDYGNRGDRRDYRLGHGERDGRRHVDRSNSRNRDNYRNRDRHRYRYRDRHYYPRYRNYRYYYPYSSLLGFYVRPYGYFGGYLGYGYDRGHYGHGYGYGYHRHGRHSLYYSRGRAPESDQMGGLDFDVRPEKAEIFIDGQFIGVADQYDGFPSYLWLEKGTYDVVIYREGFETISRQISIYPGVVIDIEDRMRKGESVPPEELVSKSTERRDERLRRDRERAAEAEQAERRAQISSEEKIGRLHLAITPQDAAVYLDGHFLGIAAEIAQLHAGLIVEPGEHVVEVVHPGFETVSRSFEIEQGEKLDLDLDLSNR